MTPSVRCPPLSDIADGRDPLESRFGTLEALESPHRTNEFLSCGVIRFNSVIQVLKIDMLNLIWQFDPSISFPDDLLSIARHK